MRFIHVVRLTLLDAAKLDRLYHLAYPATAPTPAVQAEREFAVEDFAAQLFYSRTMTRPAGWKWMYKARALYISAI